MSDDMATDDRLRADRGLDDEELWSEPVEPPSGSTPPRRRPRRAQVAIRLDGDLLDSVQRIASEAGVGYTTMLRQWIQERAEAESSRAAVRQVSGRHGRHVIAVYFSEDVWHVARRLTDGTAQVIYKHPHYLPALRAARDVAISEGAQNLDLRWFESPADPYWERVAESAADAMISERATQASDVR